MISWMSAQDIMFYEEGEDQAATRRRPHFLDTMPFARCAALGAENGEYLQRWRALPATLHADHEELLPNSVLMHQAVVDARFGHLVLSTASNDSISTWNHSDLNFDTRVVETGVETFGRSRESCQNTDGSCPNRRKTGKTRETRGNSSAFKNEKRNKNKNRFVRPPTRSTSATWTTTSTRCATRTARSRASCAPSTNSTPQAVAARASS